MHSEPTILVHKRCGNIVTDATIFIIPVHPTVSQPSACPEVHPYRNLQPWILRKQSLSIRLILPYSSSNIRSNLDWGLKTCAISIVRIQYLHLSSGCHMGQRWLLHVGPLPSLRRASRVRAFRTLRPLVFEMWMPSLGSHHRKSEQRLPAEHVWAFWYMESAAMAFDPGRATRRALSSRRSSIRSRRAATRRCNGVRERRSLRRSHGTSIARGGRTRYRPAARE